MVTLWASNGQSMASSVRPPPLNGGSRCFTAAATSMIPVAARTSWSFQVDKDISFTPSCLCLASAVPIMALRLDSRVRVVCSHTFTAYRHDVLTESSCLSHHSEISGNFLSWETTLVSNAATSLINSSVSGGLVN